MAPEALQYHIFSRETDVWAFGIVLWEIATLGKELPGSLPNSSNHPSTTFRVHPLPHAVRPGGRTKRAQWCQAGDSPGLPARTVRPDAAHVAKGSPPEADLLRVSELPGPDAVPVAARRNGHFQHVRVPGRQRVQRGPGTGHGVL